jgi:DNA-binding LytR/AlgR family response regulator
MKILLVEDEPFAQQELKRMLKKFDSSIEILATLDSVEETVSYLKSEIQPDLVFMDIELSDGSSFEIFTQVKVTIPVIFTTAYNEHALKAFKVNAIDYLLKPIEEEALFAAITKYKDIKEQYASPNSLTETDELEPISNRFENLLKFASSTYKSRFLVTIADKMRYIDVDDIAYFFAQDSTVFLVTKEKRQFIINYNLEELEQHLNPRTFFRLNRKYISSITAINDVQRHFNSRLKVSLNPAVSDEVLVSRVKVPELLSWLDS